ncbi:cell division protein FtsI [Paenibacillus sp. CAA11]|uniref:peptidoglycan D,D-transpeptidase FtsI family protein n=1 Tax=Paenibacillus sp. CAA11 TaxID=1532905 RepID=UPI000D331D10|nr:penicillin-binding transpeptidase domain-containing protein [Paenibacillus sp. CAA11]AWB45891.1 cell division protein FtsI [Paenibacillus sp. CAA11]
MKKAYSEDPRQEEASRRRHFNIRLNIFFFSAFAIFTVIIVRLAIIQFVEGPTLSAQESSLNVKNVPLPPSRGSIISRDNVKLAYSTPVQSLYMTLLKDYSKNTGAKNRPEAMKLAADIVAVFNKYGNPKGEKLTVDDVVKAMDLDSKINGGYAPRRLKVDLTDKEVAYFMEHKEDFPGIDVVEESIRHYASNSIAVQTIGYVKKFKGASYSLPFYKELREAQSTDPSEQYIDTEDVGYDGLEYQYQSELRGKNGYKSVPINQQNMADGVSDIIPPVKGNDVHTNIDSYVQQKTQEAITDQLKWLHTHAVSGKTHPNAQTGYAVAIEVDTGKVVAMASMPDYDPNNNKGWNIENYQNGTITPYMSGRSGHDLESVVLMGSTIKPLSVLIGLNEKLFSTSTPYTDRGITHFGKNDSGSVRNSQGHNYGYLKSPAEAIKHSSNVFMVDMISKLLYKKYHEQGIDKWDKYMKQFGLGVSTEVDLPKEYLGYREYMNKKETVLSRLVYSTWGQQGKYTTLQLAQYTAMLANRGKRLQPQLVDKITDQQGKVVKQFTPKVLNKVDFKKSYWDEVIKGMATKVSAFDDFPYDFARKTGTSTQDVYKDGRRIQTDNGVFIAFAPRKNPKLAVAVVIPEGGFGAQSAAPVARKIFDAYDYQYGLDGVPKKTLKSATDSKTNE